MLQPGYCGLLTRDGLEVVEPLTRRVLWTRRDMPERTQIYGDARYIVLVETDANWQAGLGEAVCGPWTACRSRGAADSGRVLATAKSYQIIGRHALIDEGTGDQPRVLRLLRPRRPARTCGGRSTTPRRFRSSRINSEWTGFVKSNGEAEIIDDVARARRWRRSRSTRRTWRPT